MFRTAPRTLVALLALAGTAPAALAQEAAQPDQANDPRLFATYEALVNFLSKQESYSVDVRLDWKMLDRTQQATESGSNSFHFVFQRPGKFRLEVHPEGRAETSLLAVSDGTTVTAFHPASQLYSCKPFHDTLDALERDTLVATSLQGTLIDTLFRSDLVAIVASHVTGAKLLGPAQVAGRTVDRYYLRWHDDDEELWIGPADEPLPRKLMRTTKVEEPDGVSGQLVATTTLTWDLARPIPAETFRIELPAAATAVDDLNEALSRNAVLGRVGQKAPELELPPLNGDGQAIRPLEPAGKIHVLAFWAAWEPGSGELLLEAARVLQDPEFRELAFHAIHVGPEADQARGFLASHQPALASLLDARGEAAEACGVNDLPAFILVDSAGKLAAALTPPFQELPRTLRAELTRLLNTAHTPGPDPGP